MVYGSFKVPAWLEEELLRRSAHVGKPEMDEEYSINKSKIFMKSLKHSALAVIATIMACFYMLNSMVKQ